MPPSERAFAPTPLRLSYERVRVMDTAEQLRECIDVLENPGVIVSEVLESFRVVDRAFKQGVLDPVVLAERSEQRIERAETPEWIYEGRDLSVHGDSCSFTCLSSNVEPIPEEVCDPKAPAEGLDFVGITCNESARPVLGTVQSEADSSPLPLLLRALVGLAEMAPVIQVKRLNYQFFKGALPPSPCFDLYLATWIFDENADRTPICAFTRDISELVKRTILEQSEFPVVLNDIVCLQMNPARFDGRMRFDWRV
ncbi:MAG: hypothetical protein JRG94_24510 [Deltaproteobacteria bacterium]|nr:hypothetical protein [Deltaproteobacteria bacterium]MBW2723803.1 hypothetical protein [Deltaproteobacteria bacterium]